MPVKRRHFNRWLGAKNQTMFFYDCAWLTTRAFHQHSRIWPKQDAYLRCSNTSTRTDRRPGPVHDAARIPEAWHRFQRRFETLPHWSQRDWIERESEDRMHLSRTNRKVTAAVSNATWLVVSFLFSPAHCILFSPAKCVKKEMKLHQLSFAFRKASRWIE